MLESPVLAKESSKADAGVLRLHVEKLVNDLSPRDAFAESLDPVAEYIYEEFARYGDPVYQNVPLGIDEVRNVELTIAGQSDEAIVIGAHYDAFDGLPGADDNASGVAGVLELARLLAGAELPVTVILVAYALEEPPNFGTPSMGSVHHARRSRQRSPSPFLMMSLEMIGYFCDKPKCQRHPLPLMGTVYPSTGNFIAAIGRRREKAVLRTVKRAFLEATEMPIETLALGLPGASLSDHRNYWYEDIKAIMITDTAYQRNPNYHTADDTPDTLDYERMALVVDGVVASIAALGRERLERIAR
ncbi:MAG: M28 family peptidase [Pseudomonadota bacterium]